MSASIPFIASQAAPADVVQADSLPVGVSADGLELWLHLDETAGATTFTDAFRWR